MKTVILAFSGGLDTSFCIPHLQKKGYKVITATVHTGGFMKDELQAIKMQSKKLGAIKHYEVDAKKDLYDKFASYIIKANYLKGGVYPACVGPERNVIAEKIVEVAKKEKATAIAHGSTGAGNDQARFDFAFKALMPEVEILTPIRDGGHTRKQEVTVLKKAGINVNPEIKDYSINIGLLGTTIGGKETKGTDKELPDSVFPNVKSINEASNKYISISIKFKKGLPVSLNGKKMDGVSIINKLNTITVSHSFGKDYHIGTTIIGIKGKIGFEAPALKLLIKAHSELEKITLTSKQLFWKNILGNLYGDLIHEGLFLDPLVKNLEAFLDSSNKYATGTVQIKLYKGNLEVQSIKSKYSLLNSNMGIYGEEVGNWSGQDAASFCKLYGMESVNAYLTQNNHD